MNVFRGAVYHSLSMTEGCYLNDGALIVDALGSIVACGDWQSADIQTRLENTSYKLTQLNTGQMLVPGFIDLHVHLPQMGVTGRQDASLLNWLNKYVFAEESRFEDLDYADYVSRWFFNELLKNGTTTAAVFLTSHKEAVNRAFEIAEETGNRAIMGLNLMDKNGPDSLLRDTQQTLKDTEALCQQWHGRDQNRLQYAWMPRFAITSTEELLEGIGALRTKYPDVYQHTHLSEQKAEIDAVSEQFPWAKDYLEVYQKYGLTGPRSIFAHAIHLSDDEIARVVETESCLAHCPGSNFFLKSGRFRLYDMIERNVRFGLGSDVGAGPELSMFKVMKDTQFMQRNALVSPDSLFYMATLGAARALHLDDTIGNFEVGKEADFSIINWLGKSNVFAGSVKGIQDILSLLIYLGDERMIDRTFVRGRQVYVNKTPVLA